MAKLSRHTIHSSYQLSVREHPGTDPLGNSDDDEVAHLFSVSKPNLSEYTRICRVFHLHAHARGVLDRSLNVEFRPSKVRGENDSPGQVIETPGDADPDSLENAVRVNLHQVANLCCEGACRNPRISSCGHCFLGEEIPIHVSHAYRCLGGPQVCYQNRASIIQPKESRPSAAGQPTDGPMDYPFFTNQLFGDERNGTSLKP